MTKKLVPAFVILLSFLFLFTNHVNQPAENKVVAFGAIKHKKNRVSGVSVKVLQNNEVVEDMVTGRVGAYGFSLEFNNEYNIIIAKEGYLKEIIHINTRVPEEVISYGADILWEPDFSIHEIMPSLSVDEFRVPIASYKFDKEYWGFIEDNNYKLKVESQITEVLNENDTLRKIAFRNTTKLADSLFNSQNYEEALLAYNLAQQYNSNDKYAATQIKSSKKLLKKQYSIDAGYQQALRKADEYLNKGDLEAANNYYQKALIYKPKEIYPLDKLYEIDSLRSYSWIQANTAFETYIGKGDSLFSINSYEESKKNYAEAIDIFPNKTYPTRMMRTIDSLIKIEDQKEVQLIAEKIDTIDKLEGKKPLNTRKTSSIDKPDKEASDKPDTKQQKTETLSDKAEVAHEQEIKKPTTSREAITENRKIDETSDRLQDIAYKGDEKEENLVVLEKSLKEKLQLGDKKGSSQILTEIGKVYQSEFELGKALKSFNQSLNIKREIGDKPGEAEILGNIASVMYDSGSYDAAIQTFEQSLSLSEDINEPVQSAEILTNLATVYESTFRYDEAISSLNRSLELKIDLGDKEGSSDLYKRMSNIYYEQSKFDNAIEELEKSYTIDEQLNNKEEMASGLNAMGAVYYNMNEYNRAEEYFEKSLDIIRETKNQRIEAITLNNLGNINFSNKRFNKALEYYEKSLKLKSDLSFKEGMATTLHNIGNSYFALKQYTKALEYYRSSQDVAEEVNYKEVIWKNLEAFAKTFAALGRYKEAFKNYREYTNSKYEFMGQTRQLVELREQYESSKMAVKTLKRELKKQSRIARLEAERNRREMQIIQLEMENKLQQLKRNRIIIISFIIVSLIILIFSVIITKQYRLTHKAYKLVAEQKKHITDGISYAARIQKAVLPPEKYTKRVLPEYFILNKPCEVVGGDFYWVATHYNKTVVAVSDCTGHGVPGGFMSMLGIAILNEIISIERPLESHEILTLLRDRVVESLHQKHRLSESLDGMDITLVILDIDKNELQFSAAYHSLFLIRNGELEKIKGDRVPIGYHRLSKPFTSQNIKLQKGDMIYLTTDGFIDQIGHKTKERFMLTKFKEELLAIYKKPLREQEAHLEKIISDWKGNVDQTDDILVMGLRF